MANVFKKAMRLLVGDPNQVKLTMPKNRQVKQLTDRELIQLESEIGSKLFGEIPAGHRREFFCLDENTWIWYEEWIDPATKKSHSETTRYEIHDNGILKVLEGARYTFIEGVELDNFVMATRLYYEQVARQVYNTDPYTGQKLTVAL